MTTSSPRGSAEIYEFPLRGRFARNVREQQPNLEAQAATRAAASGWYHDAAIAEEAERLRNN